MRAGQRTRPWTSQEVRFLLDNAGRMPLRELCRSLRRSASSVTSMAARMRAQGRRCDLRHWEPTLVVCPSCGQPSATARETGVCRPCQLRRRLAAIEGSCADLLARMPAGDRATYGRTEAEVGEPRAHDPMPRRPRADPRATPYERDRDAEAHARAVEEWEARRLQRAVGAARKRRERMRRRLRDE